MDAKRFWHIRWARIFLALLCFTLLAAACEAVPADSGQQVQRRWDQQLAEFWNQSLGRIVNPAMAWLAETFDLARQKTPQLAAQVWEWIKTQAQAVADWFRGAPPETPPVEQGGSVLSRKIVRRFP